MFSTHGHEVHATRDGDEATDSDTASWLDDSASDDLSVADDLSFASKVGATDPTLQLIEDKGDSLALDQSSTLLRSHVNKISSYQSSSLHRSSANKISAVFAFKSGATLSASELPQVEDDSLAFNQIFSCQEDSVEHSIHI
eukprot:TRINITY_DN11254_c0_g2_i1.p1 TRINITY_DN11254_c0_g2~~TRINITY_DN11254_c0_g2_i1.p1  ORF type:complete len:141 (+),score=19.78 TRINITY_DN11254_c0_g2_i1:547-969(+)